ncbi:hypothetical protein ACWEOW_11220 [Monashia sp. NPDC004114]
MWATKAQARAIWPDAVAFDDTTLDMILAAAHPTCVAYAPKLIDRVVTDGVTTNGSKTLTSATAAFVPREIGRSISGSGIPASTTIETVIDATTVILSAAATATATGVSVSLSGVPMNYVVGEVYQAREVYAASQRGEQDVIGVGDYAIRARPLTAAVKSLLRPQRVVGAVG